MKAADIHAAMLKGAERALQNYLKAGLISEDRAEAFRKAMHDGLDECLEEAIEKVNRN